MYITLYEAKTILRGKIGKSVPFCFFPWCVVLCVGFMNFWMHLEFRWWWSLYGRCPRAEAFGVGERSRIVQYPHSIRRDSALWNQNILEYFCDNHISWNSLSDGCIGKTDAMSKDIRCKGFYVFGQDIVASAHDREDACRIYECDPGSRRGSVFNIGVYLFQGRLFAMREWSLGFLFPEFFSDSNYDIWTSGTYDTIHVVIYFFIDSYIFSYGYPHGWNTLSGQCMFLLRFLCIWLSFTMLRLLCHDADFFLMGRIGDEALHLKPIELCFWEAISSLLFYGIFCRDHSEYFSERVCRITDRDTTFLHRLEESSMNLRRSTIDLIGEEYLREYWSFPSIKLCCLWTIDFTPDKVRGEEIRSEWDTPELEVERLCECSYHERLRESWDSLEEDMSSGEECYDEPIDRVTLSDDAFTDRLSEGIDRFIERSKNWIHVKENDSESIGIFLSVARGEAIWLIGWRNSPFSFRSFLKYQAFVVLSQYSTLYSREIHGLYRLKDTPDEPPGY